MHSVHWSLILTQTNLATRKFSQISEISLMSALHRYSVLATIIAYIDNTSSSEVTASLASHRQTRQLQAFELLKLRNSEEPSTLVLCLDTLELVHPSISEIVGQPGHDSLHLLGRVAAVVLQGRAPQRVNGQRRVQGVERQPERGCREKRARDVDQVIVQETNLQRVLSEVVR